MGKKNQPVLGRSIIKDRFRGKNRTVSGKQSYLHTAELNDGYDWGRLNVQSVTEQSNLEDFLTTAELAGTEFTAEKLNIKFVDPGCNIGMLSSEEKQNVQEAQQKHRNLLQIPRRPPWTEKTSGEELESLERASFLTWRKQLAKLQEEDHIVLTPFEKTLDFWRQLWRVIERSDVIVQIVDARNPLLFYCSDLQHYVSEVSKSKVNLLLVNKADYLSAKQREDWADYFCKLGVRVAFWSALEETERQNEEALKEKKEAEDDMKETNLVGELESIADETQIVMENDTSDKDDSVLETNIKIVNSLNIKEISDSTLNSAGETESIQKNIPNPETDGKNSPEIGVVNSPETDKVKNCDNTCFYVKNSSELMSGQDLLNVFRSMHSGPYHTENILTIGMVGYPNVGKSSTINAILRTKKVPVSATPGRTKHFQTLFVEPSLMLCDCPGLVFPSFVSTKAELVVNGILPVDQMRDHLSPINLICERIPRPVLELVYGINIRKPPEGDDPDRRPNAYELLNAYGAMRGYMTATGAPDGSRSSRYIIKDYINGKILYCHPPTGINSEDFQEAPVVRKSQVIVPLNLDETEKKKPTTKTSSIDKDFFSKMYPVSHFKGVKGTVVPGRPDTSTPYGSSQSINNMGEKPWRHHNNRNKKEKLRRVYSHLDKHDYY